MQNEAFRAKPRIIYCTPILASYELIGMLENWHGHRVISCKVASTILILHMMASRSGEFETSNYHSVYT